MSSRRRSERITNLYRQHAGSLLRFLLKASSGDTQLAEDLLQETFLRAWCSTSQVGWRWLYKVAVNLAIDHRRRSAARPETSIEDLLERACVDCELDQVEDAVDLVAVLLELRWERCDLLVRYYLLDQSADEIAAALAIPVGTVRSRLHYALRAARRNA